MQEAVFRRGDGQVGAPSLFEGAFPDDVGFSGEALRALKRYRDCQRVASSFSAETQKYLNRVLYDAIRTAGGAIPDSSVRGGFVYDPVLAANTNPSAFDHYCDEVYRMMQMVPGTGKAAGGPGGGELEAVFPTSDYAEEKRLRERLRECSRGLEKLHADQIALINKAARRVMQELGHASAASARRDPRWVEEVCRVVEETLARNGLLFEGAFGSTGPSKPSGYLGLTDASKGVPMLAALAGVLLAGGAGYAAGRYLGRKRR